MEFFAEDIRWEGPRASGLPDSGTFNGKPEVAWMFKHRLKVPWVHIWRFDGASAARVQTLRDSALVKQALSG
jgi:hypothetical protein